MRAPKPTRGQHRAVGRGRIAAYPEITGCNLLQFEPTIEMHPEVTQAEEPSGYEIKIKVPQNPERVPHPGDARS